MRFFALVALTAVRAIFSYMPAEQTSITYSSFSDKFLFLLGRFSSKRTTFIDAMTAFVTKRTSLACIIVLVISVSFCSECRSFNISLVVGAWPLFLGDDS